MQESRRSNVLVYEWDTMTLNAIVPARMAGEALERFQASKEEWRRWLGFGTHHHPAPQTSPEPTFRQLKRWLLASWPPIA